MYPFVNGVVRRRGPGSGRFAVLTPDLRIPSERNDRTDCEGDSPHQDCAAGVALVDRFQNQQQRERHEQVRLDRREGRQGARQSETSLPGGPKEPDDTQQQEPRNLAQEQQEKRRGEAEGECQSEPGAFAWAGKNAPEQQRGTGDGGEIEGEPDELPGAPVHHSERQCEWQRPRWIPHHHRIVPARADFLLERVEHAPVVRIPARRDGAAGTPILHIVEGAQDFGVAVVRRK